METKTIIDLQEVLIANSLVDPKRTVKLQAFPEGLLLDEYMEPGLGELDYKDGIPVTFSFTCPGCGRYGVIRIDSPNPTITALKPSWEIVALNPLTLSPSINCVGCCGWHGFLKDGVFVPC